MDFFIFLIFVAFFILPALTGRKKKAKAKDVRSLKWGTPEAREKARQTARDYIDQKYPKEKPSENSSNSNQPWGASGQSARPIDEVAARIKTISVNQARQYAAHKAGKRLPKEEHYHAPIKPQAPAGDSRDADDRNSSRRSDWGARAGPGVLSTRNILILLAIGLVLAILAKTPMNVFS